MATNTKTQVEHLKSVWTNDKKNEFQYYKENGTSITICLGTWLLLPNRPDKVIVDKIYSLYKNKIDSLESNGPCGISYLPWRENENRFASPSFSMRGNSRFIVCYPVGRNTYGSHIDWDKVEVCTKPENVTDTQISDVLCTLRDYVE